jgi:hypothetical protein
VEERDAMKPTLQSAAEGFVAEKGFAYGFDPLTIIAIIRLAITLYDCLSGNALLRTLRASWGLGVWVRQRALKHAVKEHAGGTMAKEDVKAVVADLDEYVVEMFRSMSDDNALTFIKECYAEMGLDAAE